MALIELKHVVAGYGGAPILNGVNMAIDQSDIGVVVGPNGAGKSTTLKAILGLLKVTGGTIEFDGEEIANSLPDRLVPKGLSFVPQEKNPFSEAFLIRERDAHAWVEVYLPEEGRFVPFDPTPWRSREALEAQETPGKPTVSTLCGIVVNAPRTLPSQGPSA